MKETKLLSKKIGYTLFGLIGFVCAFLWKAEGDLAAQSNILWTGEYILRILLFSLLVGVLAGAGGGFFVYFFAERTSKSKGNEGKTLCGWKVFLISLTLTVFFWLPCYLAYYPGICSYDTTIQMEQIVSGVYNDHHPIVHTLLMQGAMELGDALFNSVTAGIGIYAAFQMLFLASAFAYAVKVLYAFSVHRVWLVLLQLYTVCYPFHWYMSVSTVKDTVFSGFFLFQMISLYVLLLHRDKLRLRSQYTILFGFSTVGMMLFRNNGRYAMLVLLIFALFALWKGKQQRKIWAKLFGCILVTFLAGNLLGNALFYLTNAGQGDRREMLSMPIQQMARCMIYHGGVGVLPEDDNTMGEADKAFINQFLLDESYKEYRPDISDPVKRHTNTSAVRYHIKEFAETYLNLFLQYPGDYINAVLAVNAGYLSPQDISHAVINVNGRDRGLGYVQTRWVEHELNPVGIYKASMWEGLHEKLENWADNNAYLDLPLLKYLFVPGSYLWFYLILAGCLCIHRKYDRLLPLSLVLGYYITLLLGPTVQLRYIYPIMIVLPFAAILGFVKENRNHSNNE